jgi:hypothetical protein
MTGAPDLTAGFAVLHGAIQVGTNGGEGAPFARARVNQQHWQAAELHDPTLIRPEILDLTGGNLIDRGLRHLGRRHESECGIKKRNDGCRKPAAQQPAQETTAGLFHRLMAGTGATLVPNNITRLAQPGTGKLRAVAVFNRAAPLNSVGSRSRPAEIPAVMRRTGQVLTRPGLGAKRARP